ncbi:DNA replication protein [Chlamydia trachomatis]|nr:DNA replication protein [Chlamydia trachomatis]
MGRLTINNKQQSAPTVRDRWTTFMQIFRENVEPHVFEVWFEPIQLLTYDEQDKVIVLSVPNKYVYEYLEECQIKLMRLAINTAFGPGHILKYRIRKEPTFAEVVDYIKRGTPECNNQPIHIAIPDAHKRLEEGLRYYLGDKYQWLDEYDKIADWLTDNKGRGLLIVGTSGVGKSLICQRILPTIFGRNITTVTACEMNTRIDELLTQRCIIIDDLGKEDVEVKNYGNRRHPFFELCDAAEKRGILLIITTNLSTNILPEQYRSIYPDSIEGRYGKEVFSRLRAITRSIAITHDDMRG